MTSDADPAAGPATGWDEIADRCFRRRYEPFDVTVGVVLGERGAVLVDTRASLLQGHELRDDLRALGVREPLAVVNTHGHFDHCFGNAAFRPPGGRWGHASLPAHLAGTTRETMAEEFPEWARQVAADPVPPPDRLLDRRADLDLGDRTLRLHHLGRGHTGGDVVVAVPDAGCVFAGDLVEESGPPAYGADSFPLDWPATLDGLARLCREISRTAGEVIVVPGHGEPAGEPFVASQRLLVERVAGLVRTAHAAGLTPGEALGSLPGWPCDPALLAHAVRRGYRQLGGG